jgi:hypothetical protein
MYKTWTNQHAWLAGLLGISATASWAAVPTGSRGKRGADLRIDSSSHAAVMGLWSFHCSLGRPGLSWTFVVPTSRVLGSGAYFEFSSTIGLYIIVIGICVVLMQLSRCCPPLTFGEERDVLMLRRGSWQSG